MSFRWLLVGRITTAMAAVTPGMLTKLWDEFDNCLDICQVSGGLQSCFVCKLLKTLTSSFFVQSFEIWWLFLDTLCSLWVNFYYGQTKLTHQISSTLPPSSSDLWRDWRTLSLWQQTHRFSVCYMYNSDTGSWRLGGEWLGRTNNTGGDSSLCEQGGNFLLVDPFSLTLPTIWIYVNQQMFWSAGCWHK